MVELTEKKRGLLLVLGTALISGVSIFINKFGVKGIEPALFTSTKNLMVALALVSFLVLFGQTNNMKNIKRLTKKQLTKLVLIGLIGGSLPFLLFFKGLNMASAANAAFIHKTMFVWVGLFSFLFLKKSMKKSIDKRFVLACFIILVGNALLIAISDFSFGFGEVLIYIATLLWSLEIILSKSILKVKGVSGTMVASARMLFGSAFLWTYLFATGKALLIASLSLPQIGWIVLTSCLLFGYVITFYNGLKWVDAVTATSVLLIGSVVTTLLQIMSGYRIPTINQVVGIVLLIMGIGYLAGLSKVLTELLKRVYSILSIAKAK